jgi:hypothetical protein
LKAFCSNIDISSNIFTIIYSIKCEDFTTNPEWKINAFSLILMLILGSAWPLAWSTQEAYFGVQVGRDGSEILGR